MTTILDRIDPAVAAAIENENRRQRDSIVLIASENYASKAVLEAQAQLMNNKYAEGYPGRRYYGGCEFVDVVETLAIDRARELFGAEHANVQAHSGAQANMAAYFAVLEPGDTVLGMQLDMGGHLTHGAGVNFSGNLYQFVPYGVDQETETIDYDQVERLAKEHNPKLIVAGCSSYSRVLDFPRFRAIADSVGALLMVDMAHISGLIAGGAHPSPFPHAQVVTSTTQKTLRGPRGGMILTEEELGRKVDFAVFPYMQGGPFMHVIAAKAVCFGEALSPDYARYAEQVVSNAQTMASELSEAGLRLVSGGTDNHLMLIDLTATYKQLSGRQAADHLEAAGIIVNKNTIPLDKRSATTTSGVRLGTPMISGRGMKEGEMQLIADLITETLEGRRSAETKRGVREKGRDLCGQFPIYEDRNLWT